MFMVDWHTIGTLTVCAELSVTDWECWETLVLLGKD
jgi:hypothetical protein